MWVTLANAASAAAAASWLTNPLDLAKLRLQVGWGGRVNRVAAPGWEREAKLFPSTLFASFVPAFCVDTRTAVRRKS